MAKTPGWYAVTTSARPTELDRQGCDGLYIEAIRIHWWHPGCWVAVGRAVVRDLGQRLVIKLIRVC